MNGITNAVLLLGLVFVWWSAGKRMDFLTCKLLTQQHLIDRLAKRLGTTTKELLTPETEAWP